MVEFTRENETVSELISRCTNISHFDCTEDAMLWVMMGPRRLPLQKIVPISVLLLVIFVTGVVGNLTVCVVIVRHPTMHTATNYYLFSLALSDLLLLLFGLPNDLSVSWHQYPYSLGIVFCKLRALISEAASYGSVLTIVAFSLERYLAICHPLHLYAMAGLRRALRVVAALWLLSFVAAAPFASYTTVSYHDYPPGSGNSSLESAFCAMLEVPSWYLYELSSLLFFILPGLIILCLYVRMGLRIRSTHTSKPGSPGTLNGVNGSVHGEARQAQSKKTIIRMLAAVVIAFFVCWAPFHFQRLFYIYGTGASHYHIINEYLFYVAGAFYYVSATVNPILYNVMSHRYRIAFKETLFCKKATRIRSKYIEQSSTRETVVHNGRRTRSKYRNERKNCSYYVTETSLCSEWKKDFYQQKKMHVLYKERSGSELCSENEASQLMFGYLPGEENDDT
ncbi:neuropeptides capa receptor-like [Bombyx mandarina]|uniref:Neuropeptide receptor A27 n=2 Tax=Bombyx TaxID=7090 RepID=B3XXP0_BOMMO|nr:neuropeptide receptor A27 [Bombyx mori]XP_028035611.1 neuropeptides capa receptor-like [Bombyx mandarina]BAG68426.1 neuropeptide receptor A27 [Bombyx mori]